MGNAQVAAICKTCGVAIRLTNDFMKDICAEGVAPAFVEAMVDASGDLFARYQVDSCSQTTHLLAQAKKETAGFLRFRESLNYSRATYTAAKLYRLAPTAINNGFVRRGLVFKSLEEKLDWIDQHLLGNDVAYGEHCFGSSERPGKDFRGRGLLHLTHYETYKKFARETGIPIDVKPELLERDFSIAIESALWFWKNRGIANIAENPLLLADAAVAEVTRPINTGLAGLAQRQHYTREVTQVFQRYFNSRCSRRA